MIIALLVVAGFALYVMNGEERARLLRVLLGAGGVVKTAASKAAAARFTIRGDDGVRRFPVVVTPILLAVHAGVFALMLLGSGALADPHTLVEWGGNFGPRTTNGEWWRLGTATFVHAGPLHLFADLAGLAFAGLMLEPLVGPVAFAAVYVMAGGATSVVNLSVHSVGVSVGASGPIFGLYGLLVAALMWGLLDRSPLAHTLVRPNRLVVGAAVFVLYNVIGGGAHREADVLGFYGGFACGLLLARRADASRPPVRRIAVLLAATAVIAIACVVPLRGLTDIRPEIQRVVALEQRTADAYEAAVDRFRRGRMTAEALAQVIEQTIVPELQAAGARLKRVKRVPNEHQPLFAAAQEYLRLRGESWMLRARALHKRSMPVLREADRAERASLDALEKLRTAELM